MSDRSDLEEELVRLRQQVDELRSEAAANSNVAMLRAAEDLAHLGAFSWDAVSGRLTASPGLEAIVGVDLATLSTVDDALQLVVADDRKRVTRLSRLALQGGEVNPTQFRVNRNNGEVVHVMGRLRAQLDDDGTLLGIEGALMDISERRQIEGRLLQSQKMEAISTLGAGVANDFSTLLETIEGHVDLMELDPTVAHKTRRSVKEISGAVARCRDLIDRLLTFSRKQESRPAVNDVRALLSAASRTVRRTLGDDVELKVVCEPDPCLIRVDPVQFEQVLLNLSINARDAMPDGGTLQVLAARVTLDSQSSRVLGVPTGTYCRVQVRDTGIGMDEETCARAFEPFFTTKPKGSASGLGLSTVHGIVRRAEGVISIDSTPGEGTLISLLVPASVPQPEKEKPAVDSRYYPTGSETILLVEDGEQARAVTKSHLERAGYNVLAAPDGEAALDLAEVENVPIHLLITDVTIPRLSGPELAGRLHEKFPTMRVIFMSGYTERFVFRKAALHSERVSMHKPFSMGELLTSVREQLDALRKT